MLKRSAVVIVLVSVLTFSGFGPFTLRASESLPAYCGKIGVESCFGGFEAASFPHVVLERGSVIVVSTTSDAVNGDVSSVRSLLANPGSDGISLREAIMVTNNDPGVYTIRFATSLRGSTIKVGSAPPYPQATEMARVELPPLLAGNVIINGDIDGDGRADVTLTNEVRRPRPVSEDFPVFAFRVSSSENTLYGLAIHNFSIGVLLHSGLTSLPKPFARDTTFANIVISNLTMKAIDFIGIALWPILGAELPAPATRNRWVDTVMVGNIIESKERGIDANFVAGERVEHTRIVNNTVRIIGGGIGSFGINLGLGFWVGSPASQVVDTEISSNLVETDYSEGAIRLSAGENGASGNVIEDVRVVGNTIRISLPNKPEARVFQTHGILILTGDGATDHVDPNYRPIGYPEDNMVRNVWLSRNVIEGQGGHAVMIQASCCGAKENLISQIFVLGNRVRGVVPQIAPDQSGVYISAAVTGGFLSRPSAENEVSSVIIQGNSIELSTKTGPQKEKFVSGGIVVWGGRGASSNRVTDVFASHNYVNASVVGVNVLGGWGERDARASNNMVSRVQVWCNHVAGVPSLITPNFQGVRGINVAGGFSNATNNVVDQIQLEDNLVAGVLNDVSVFADVDRGASDNKVGLATQTLVAQLRARVDQLDSELKTLQAQVSQKSREIEALKSELARLTSQLDSTRADVSEKASMITSLKAEISKKESEVATLRAEVGQSRAKLESAIAELYSATGQLLSAREQLQAAFSLYLPLVALVSAFLTGLLVYKLGKRTVSA